MIAPYASKVLQRHRVEDERGLHFNWQNYSDLLGAMHYVIQHAPQDHVPDAPRALQDAFSIALHQAQAVQVGEADMAAPGDNEWSGQPLWLEFATPRTLSGNTFEGALIFKLALGTGGHLVLPILMGRGREWPLPFVVSTSLREKWESLTGEEPATIALRTVLHALTHVPSLPEQPVQHEANPTLLARLERHLKRVRTLTPETSQALARLYLKSRHTWDPRTFVPVITTGALLRERDGQSAEASLLHAPEVTVINAWRYSKHVIRIDEDVLARLRRSRLLGRLPTSLPGLRGYATYIPVPGGLSHPSQTGFFVAIDEVEGQPRLLLLIEQRLHGDHLLAPISLPLGGDVQAELEAMTRQGTTNFTSADVSRVAQDINLALMCVAYVGSPKTQLLGPGTPTLPKPRRGKGGKEELVEPGHTPIWEAGVDTGNQLRAYTVQQSQGQGAHATSGVPTGRTMPPHLREPHLHGYWVGEGRTQYELKFLDFIPVNMDQDDQQSPVRLHSDE